MRRVLMAGLAVLALAFTPALRALDEPPETKAKQTPKQQFQSVLDEYQKAMRDWSQAYAKAKTNQERNKLFQEKYPNPNTYAERFLAITEANPDDPAAIDALVWAVQLGRSGGKNNALIERLVVKNAANPKIGRLTSTLAYSYAPWAEGALRSIAEKNPDHAAKGQATMALAPFLNRRIELVRTFKDDPNRAKQLAPFLTAQGYDKDAIEKLKATDPEVVAKEVEGLFEKIVKEFSDVSSGRGTLGKRVIVKENIFAQCFDPTRINPMFGLGFWLNTSANHSGVRETDIEKLLEEKWQQQDWHQRCICNNAPNDLVAAVGSGYNRLFVIPSLGLVIVRQGSDARFSDAEFLTRLLRR